MEEKIMHQTMTGYVDALVAREPYGQYFTDDVVCSLMGEDLEVSGRDAVEGFIIGFHTQAFDARPELKTLFVGDSHAAIEARFIGTHTAEFLGVPASGRSVDVPYSVVYDLEGGKIKALRIYMPMDVLMRQLSPLPASQPATV